MNAATSVVSSSSAFQRELEEAVKRHRAGDFSTAEMLYRRIMKHHPKDSPAAYLLGMLLLQRHGVNAEALTLLEGWVESGEGDTGEFTTAARVLRSAGRNRAAIVGLQRAIATTPSDQKAYREIAILLISEGRFQELYQILRQAFDQDPPVNLGDPTKFLTFDQIRSLQQNLPRQVENWIAAAVPAQLVAQDLVIPTAPEADDYQNLFEPAVSIRTGSQVQGHCRIGTRTEVNGATIYPHTTIGRYCAIARGAAISAPNHPLTTLSSSLALSGNKAVHRQIHTQIGNDVWIGANAVVLAGLTVGDGAIIGAGAVVTKDVRPYDVVVGVPARPVKRRFSDDICERLLAVAWWNYDHELVDTLPHDDVEACLRIAETWPRRED